MTLAFRVGAVTYDRGRIDVVAFDALGVLAHMLPRRAKVLQKGDRLRMADVEALCHWSGLTTTGTGTLPQAVYPATDTCSVTTPPSHPGGYHAGGVLLADGRVLLVLGVSGDLQDCRIWDPATDNYVPAPELSSQPPLGQGAYLGGCVLVDGRVVFAPYYGRNLVAWAPGLGAAYGRDIALAAFWNHRP